MIFRFVVIVSADFPVATKLEKISLSAAMLQQKLSVLPLIILTFAKKMMSQYTFLINKGVARNPLVRLDSPIDVAIAADEQVAILGANGAGKTLLVDTLMGKYPLGEGTADYNFAPRQTNTIYENVKYIAFRDTYGSADTGYYYQQRWNVQEQDEVPTVREVMQKIQGAHLRDELYDLFGIEDMLDKKIISLSSGELRKFQLVKVLITAPRVLIMDNPFIGLDAETRRLLADLMSRLIQMTDLQIILVLSMLDDVPDFITHVIPVVDRKVKPKLSREDYVEKFRRHDAPVNFDALQQRIIDLPQGECGDESEIIKFNSVTISYDDRKILNGVDWTVNRGEKWALTGSNGSGKSTLLSLVCADNPQAYACNISLFGRKRGTGESIWEIKRRIGYVSPEMHRAYMKNLPAIEIVASGLHDSIGLYVRPKESQFGICEWWMDVFGVADKRDTPFLQLSSGEQRLMLLARAFVKDPELVILDEPLHGLDTYNRRRVKKVIEAFCQRKGKTMIMVTHYASEMPGCITNRLVLDHGKVTSCQ
jgi:molybdate transport system ATP-binding protein